MDNMLDNFKLVNYTDVWGNEKDGYEVNNLCIERDNLKIHEDCTEKDLLNNLVEIGFLITSDKRRVRVDMQDWDMMEIYAVKGREPIGRLEKKY